MEAPIRLAKLDSYNYWLDFEKGKLVRITVVVDRVSSVDVADIATEINASDGNIYVEGHYCKYKETPESMRTFEDPKVHNRVYLPIDVTEI